MSKLSAYLSLLFVATSIAAFAQSQGGKASTASDYSKEAYVLEQSSDKFKFENDRSSLGNFGWTTTSPTTASFFRSYSRSACLTDAKSSSSRRPSNRWLLDPGSTTYIRGRTRISTTRTTRKKNRSNQREPGSKCAA